MTGFKRGDWIYPKDEQNLKILKILEPDTFWPTRVTDVELGLDTFLWFEGCLVPRCADRFRHVPPPDKDLGDYL